MSLQDLGILVSILIGLVGLGSSVLNIYRTRKADETEEEKRDRQYWREVARDLRGRVIILEEADKLRTKEIANLRIDIRNRDDALEYLMDEVRKDYPVQVFIASEMATGKRRRPPNGDDPSEHD